MRLQLNDTIEELIAHLQRTRTPDEDETMCAIVAKEVNTYMFIRASDPNFRELDKYDGEMLLNRLLIAFRTMNIKTVVQLPRGHVSPGKRPVQSTIDIEKQMQEMFASESEK